MEDTMTAVAVKNKDLTKEQLLSKLETVELAHDNVLVTLTNEREATNKYVTQIQEEYKKRIEDANKLIGYYERKFKLLNDIVNIEGGE